jgi:hypothetical protein
VLRERRRRAEAVAAWEAVVAGDAADVVDGVAAVALACTTSIVRTGATATKPPHTWGLLQLLLHEADSAAGAVSSSSSAGGGRSSSGMGGGEGYVSSLVLALVDAAHATANAAHPANDVHGTLTRAAASALLHVRDKGRRQSLEARGSVRGNGPATAATGTATGTATGVEKAEGWDAGLMRQGVERVIGLLECVASFDPLATTRR